MPKSIRVVFVVLFAGLSAYSTRRRCNRSKSYEKGRVMMRVNHSSCLWMLFALVLSCPVHAVTLDVEIRNRFRAFDYVTESAAESADLFEKYAPINADTTMVAWMSRLIRNGRASPYSNDPARTRFWKEAAGSDRAPYADDFLSPGLLMIRVSITGTDFPSGRTCSWSLDNAPIATQSCSEAFSPPSPVKVGARVSVATNGKEIAGKTINPRIRVILGLGDSYSAGEGSPDVPVTWIPNLNKGLWPYRGKADIDKYVKSRPEWLSDRCNRSFYSYQNMVALKLAAQDSHSIVAFVHLACAGAEILDGVLAPQRDPPGASADCEIPTKRQNQGDPKSECDMPYSQLHAAAMILCPDHAVTAATSDMRKSIAAPFFKLRHGHEGKTHQDLWIKDLKTCSNGPPRNVERVLISIGGNDIGFGGLIAWALLPRKGTVPVLGDAVVSLARKEGNVVCPVHPNYDEEGHCSSLSAAQRLAELPARYGALNIAFKSLLGVSKDTVVISQYPNPLRNAHDDLCENPAKSKAPNAWSALHVRLPRATFPKRWEVNLTESEASIAEEFVIHPLNGAVAAAARTNGWLLGAAENVFLKHGWCIGKDINLLDSSSASTWKPYQDEGRYIRSGNDSFLTQWPGARSRNDGLDGTMHPNALGYAAMADSSLTKLATP